MESPSDFLETMMSMLKQEILTVQFLFLFVFFFFFFLPLYEQPMLSGPYSGRVHVTDYTMTNVLKMVSRNDIKLP